MENGLFRWEVQRTVWCDFFWATFTCWVRFINPVPVYTKSNLGETVYWRFLRESGKNSTVQFSTVIFGLKDRLQKVESNHCGWETKESRTWTPLVISWRIGVFRSIVRAGKSDSHRRWWLRLMWWKRTCTTSILAIRIAVMQQNFDHFLPRSQPYLEFMFFFVLIT